MRTSRKLLAGIGTCQLSAQQKTDKKRRTHSVPFHVLKYFTIWSRVAGLETANASFSLLAIVSQFVETSQAASVGWRRLESLITRDVIKSPRAPGHDRGNYSRDHPTFSFVLANGFFFLQIEQSWGHKVRARSSSSKLLVRVPAP